MEGLTLVEPVRLYNMLQESSYKYSSLSNSNFLLLLDIRQKADYNNSHILTAIWIAKDTQKNSFVLPYFGELESKINIVVYDNNTTINELNDNQPVVQCAKRMWALGSRNKVQILDGGYEKFSAIYPFLRTQKILYTPKDLDTIKPYPFEILEGKLYLGTDSQAKEGYIRKDLKLLAFVNCTNENMDFPPPKGTRYTPENTPKIFMVNINNDVDEEISQYFKSVSAFISTNMISGRRTLVFSQQGQCRGPAIVAAYLIQKGWSYDKTLKHITSRAPRVKINNAFAEALQTWEKVFSKYK